MQKVIFKVKGIRSLPEEAKIEDKLKEQPAVEIAKANLESGKVVVVFDEDKLTESDLGKYIINLGNYQINKADKTKIIEETDTKKIKKANNQPNRSGSSGLYFGNTLNVGLFVGIGLMSLVLNLILLILLFN
jgi:cation transport ATPase